MKCLSVKQPYTYALIHGHKPVENRTWSTSIRGHILLHAGKSEIKEAVEEVIDQIAYQTGVSTTDIRRHYEATKALGCIVGRAELVDVVEDMANWWFFGPYGHVYQNPQVITPIRYTGQLGYFDVPNNMLREAGIL